MCRRGVSEYLLIPHLLFCCITNTMKQLCTLTLDTRHFLTSPKNFQSFISRLSRQFVLDNHRCNFGDIFQPWGLNKKQNCFLHSLFWFYRPALSCSGTLLPFGLGSPTSSARPPGIKQVGNVWSGSISKGNIFVATFCKEIHLHGVVCVCTGHLEDWEFHWIQ